MHVKHASSRQSHLISQLPTTTSLVSQFCNHASLFARPHARRNTHTPRANRVFETTKTHTGFFHLPLDRRTSSYVRTYVHASVILRKEINPPASINASTHRWTRSRQSLVLKHGPNTPGFEPRPEPTAPTTRRATTDVRERDRLKRATRHPSSSPVSTRSRSRTSDDTPGGCFARKEPGHEPSERRPRRRERAAAGCVRSAFRFFFISFILNP